MLFSSSAVVRLSNCDDFLHAILGLQGPARSTSPCSFFGSRETGHRADLIHPAAIRGADERRHFPADGKLEPLHIESVCGSIQPFQPIPLQQPMTVLDRYRALRDRPPRPYHQCELV